MDTPSDPITISPATAVWLPLERLQALPLTREAQLVLLQELRATPQASSVVPALLGVQAELRLRLCEDAYKRQAWDDAFAHHDDLLELVGQLVELVPLHAPAYWQRYGELLAFFTVAVHGVVCSVSADPPPQPLRAELSWTMAQRLAAAVGLPLQPPDWLAVHEQQLVQVGAGLWDDLLKQAAAPDAPVAGLPLERAATRTLALYQRLQQLMQPAPEWLQQRVLALLEPQVQAQLAADVSDPASLAALLAQLEQFPVDAERRPAFHTALTRARLALELLAPELVPRVRAAQGPAPAAEASSEPAADAPGVAAMVWRNGGDPGSPLQLELEPLLEAEPEAIEEALDDFVWHLPRGSGAQPAAVCLPAALEPRWRSGLQLEPGAFEGLASLAAAWQRRLGERLQPLPSLDWRYSLLIEFEATELAVLRPLLSAPASLEAALVELRREHHNAAFWQQRQELPWMACPPPLEALRRLHVNQGFYARSHGAMESLQAWGQEALQALLEAELWTDDAGCLGLWLGLGQELVRCRQAVLPLLGVPPEPEQLLAEFGGLEVLYVGDQAAAVQAAHRAGRCFRGEPFGLRVLEIPISRWPARPAGSFEESLAVLLEAVDGLYRQRPFAVLLADAGAYRLPLVRAVHHRYGVAALSTGLPMASWLAA